MTEILFNIQANLTSGRKQNEATARGFDYAGQASFNSLHQLFLSKRGINLIVVDASKDLEEPIADEDVRHIGRGLRGNSKGTSNFYSSRTTSSL